MHAPRHRLSGPAEGGWEGGAADRPADDDPGRGAPQMPQRVAEFIVSDAGGVTLSVRPPLPFLPDAVRLAGPGVEVYGGGRRLHLEADRDLTLAISQAGGLLLLEHPAEGEGAPRELELLLVE